MTYDNRKMCFLEKDEAVEFNLDSFIFNLNNALYLKLRMQQGCRIPEELLNLIYQGFLFPVPK